eukprot:598119-Prorocentrum_minimum.AAC.1
MTALSMLSPSDGRPCDTHHTRLSHMWTNQKGALLCLVRFIKGRAFCTTPHPPVTSAWPTRRGRGSLGVSAAPPVSGLFPQAILGGRHFAFERRKIRSPRTACGNRPETGGAAETPRDLFASGGEGQN